MRLVPVLALLLACSTGDKDSSQTIEPTVGTTTPTTGSTTPISGTTTPGTGSTTPVVMRAAHVVILGIDGMGGHFVGPVATPNIDALVAQGVSTTEMQNVLPTMSSTNWMSMIGGTTPDQHGVLSNGWDPGDSSPPPTLFATLRAQNPSAKIGVFHDWADFGRLVEPGIADAISHPGDEQQTMDAALAWMATERPELLFIHLDHVDHAGHFNTWGSNAYDTAIEDADTLVGQLVDALVAEGMWDDTLLLISADHGGVGLFHGNDTFDERAIPFVMVAPWITAPVTVQREARIFDIAPTAARALGLTPDPTWVGRPVLEGFEGLPAGPTAPIALSATTTWTQLFDDSGSGAVSDMSIWRPDLPTGTALLADAATGSHSAPATGSLAIDPAADGVVPPIAYEEMWNTNGSGANADVALWHPIAEPGYVCLGTVASATPGTPPPLDAVRCVHGDVLLPAASTEVWDDTLSGADWDAGLFACEPSGAAATLPQAFTTRRHHSDPGRNRCWGFDPARVTLP